MNDHSYPPSNERNAEHFARSVALRLSEGTQQLPYDISERLRASRVQALARPSSNASIAAFIRNLIADYLIRKQAPA